MELKELLTNLVILGFNEDKEFMCWRHYNPFIAINFVYDPKEDHKINYLKVASASRCVNSTCNDQIYNEIIRVLDKHKKAHDRKKRSAGQR